MKTVVVTGAAGGLGSALSAAFRRAGYRVVATDRRDARPDCDHFVQLDIAAACDDVDSLRETADRILDAVGPHELKVLVHNAAVQHLGATQEITLENWNESLRTNVGAPLFLTRELLPELERASGVVLLVGSVHARATKPGFVTYATSKAALAGLARAMAVDLGRRLRVLCVQPAAISTPMLEAGFEGRPEAREALAAHHPIGRISTPGEIARAVVHLAADELGFATGAVIDLDGGVLSRLHDPE